VLSRPLHDASTGETEAFIGPYSTVIGTVDIKVLATVLAVGDRRHCGLRRRWQSSRLLAATLRAKSTPTVEAIRPPASLKNTVRSITVLATWPKAMPRQRAGLWWLNCC